MKKLFINKYDVIFLDFDGTLKNSDDIKGKVFHQIFGKKLKTKIKNKILDHHKNNLGLSRNKKIPIYMKYLSMKKINLNKNRFINKYGKLIFKQVCKSKWIKGAKKFLIRNKEKQLVLVTASPHKEIIKVCKKIDIYKYFKKIYGYPNQKKIVIEKFLKKNKINTKKCIYIGNSFSDYSAAKSNKIKYLNIGPIRLKNKKITKILDFTSI